MILISVIVFANDSFGQIHLEQNTNHQVLPNRLVQQETSSLQKINAMLASRGLGEVFTNRTVNSSQTKQYFSRMSASVTQSTFETTTHPSTKVNSVRNGRNELKGYSIDGQDYIVHLLACDASDFACAFRINGIPTGKMKEGGQFQFSPTHQLRIVEISIDACNQKRYCDLDLEAYDEVRYVIENGSQNE